MNYSIENNKERIFLNMFLSIYLLFLCLNVFAQKGKENRIYEIWDNQAAPNRGKDYSKIIARGFPADRDWEAYSYPIGNGFMGANIFGRTDVERIQITDKTLTNGAPYGNGGMTNFAEVFIRFDHNKVENYKRTLNLNEAVSYVNYVHNGVKYSREYLASYPNNIIAIKLNANKKAKISCTVSMVVPYLKSKNEPNPKFGQVKAEENTITLTGTVPGFSLNYEGKIKIINEGGILVPNNDNGSNEIRVEGANSLVILIATGTNYKLQDKVFLNDTNTLKLNAKEFPNEKVDHLLAASSDLGYEQLKKKHLADYQSLFARVNLKLAKTVTNVPTKTLVQNYKKNPSDIYLEELMFQYGRYLLIASSRKGTLPCGLQGVWSQYDVTPWSGGYWHNINVQMNYWGAFSTNLAETFTPYEEYFKAYLPKAYVNANNYIKKLYPEALSSSDTGNGWCIGTGANAYSIESPGRHSGPGTGGFTTKLFWDRFEFTQDTLFLKQTVYPALLGMSTFLSKTLVPSQNGVLLVDQSASPEQIHKGSYYMTKGATFDQGFVWETYNDLLKSAQILNVKESFLDTVKKQINQLDPILIGESGQIKEFREENKYGEIGEPKHRHISQLCPIYPGTLINSSKPEWVQAVSTTLDFRGNNTTGWAMAHRMNVRARTKEAEKAHEVYSKFLRERTLPNLWTVHPPFQIDGNLGTMAGVAEMLVQSQEAFIELLPALPKVWENGTVNGLVARGNFEIAMNWNKSTLSSCSIISKNGGKCRVKYLFTENVVLKDEAGKIIDFTKNGDSTIEFDTVKSTKYFIEF